jgi:uroporphyrinogen-III synthase
MAQETPSPLQGKRIALTRPEWPELATLLERNSARVAHIPLIRIAPPAKDELAELASNAYQWVAFTSANAVHAVATSAGGRALVAGARVACVGVATAEAARDAGWPVDLQPQRPHVKGMLEAFSAISGGGRVLFPRGELAPSTLAEGLKALGFSVDDPVVYRTVPDMDGMKQLAQEIGALDAVVLASPSAVHNAAEACGAALHKPALFSIGPSTSAALGGHKLRPAGEALEPTAEAMLQAMLAYRWP